MSKLKRMKSKKNSSKLKIAFSTVLTEADYRNLPELADFTYMIGSESISLITLVNPEDHPELQIRDE